MRWRDLLFLGQKIQFLLKKQKLVFGPIECHAYIYIYILFVFRIFSDIEYKTLVYTFIKYVSNTCSTIG